MTDQNYNQNQEGQKTIVAFVVGLLIGGLIVWMFVGSPADAPTETANNDEATENTDNTDDSADNNNSDSNTNSSENNVETNSAADMEIGEGDVDVSDQPASAVVNLDSVIYPMPEGWIGVREYNNENLGNLLGVVRFSESEGLIPEEVILQRATTPGNEYAIVFYTASDSDGFNLASNVQVDGIFATFAAE